MTNTEQKVDELINEVGILGLVEIARDQIEARRVNHETKEDGKPEKAAEAARIHQILKDAATRIGIAQGLQG